jgi:general secretion pathway protein D
MMNFRRHITLPFCLAVCLGGYTPRTWAQVPTPPRPIAPRPSPIEPAKSLVPPTAVTPVPTPAKPPENNPPVEAINKAPKKPDEETSREPKELTELEVASRSGCKPLNPEAKITFNFKGEIQELVRTISKTTCKNFIITNKVRSQKFEIVSPTPITVTQAWQAFLSALSANEFTLVQNGRYYEIIQSADGTRAAVPIYGAKTTAPTYDQMITKIFKPEYASDVNAVVNYLNIFKSGKGQIHPFAASNTIIATDFGSSMARLERILSEIDRPGALEQLHVVVVQYATASEVASKLTEIFEPQGKGPKIPSPITRVAIKPGQPQSTEPEVEAETGGVLTVSKILADDRTNKLIIIASDRAFSQMQSLLRELDVPEDTTDGQIRVVKLRHADAEELATTLSNLATGQASTPRGANQPSRPPVQNAVAPRPGASGAASLFQGDVRITADVATNSLLVTASKADFTSVNRVINDLDIPRLQVFVEAVIMEVAVNNDRTLGIGFHGGVAPVIDGQETPILFSSTPNSSVSSLGAATNPAAFASLLGLAGTARGPTLAGSEAIVPGGIPAVGVVINALQTNNDVNVISTPHLLTLDNEEAEIKVNERRPFPSGLNLGNPSALAGAGGNPALAGLGFNSVSINREDVGLTLKVKPQVSDADYVRLEIEEELSGVAGIDQVTGQVITSNRAARTTVVVRSEDSVVIGGLVADRETIDEGKTPLLGDLPLIGWLFKQEKKSIQKVNLILILTPYIISGPADFQKIFERKMKERREFMELFYGQSGEYRAAVNWERRVGPISSFARTIQTELQKAENEGPGNSDQTVIRADEVAE